MYAQRTEFWIYAYSITISIPWKTQQLDAINWWAPSNPWTSKPLFVYCYFNIIGITKVSFWLWGYMPWKIHLYVFNDVIIAVTKAFLNHLEIQIQFTFIWGNFVLPKFDISLSLGAQTETDCKCWLCRAYSMIRIRIVEFQMHILWRNVAQWRCQIQLHNFKHYTLKRSSKSQWYFPVHRIVITARYEEQFC